VTHIKTDLSKYNNSWFKPGGTILSRALWYWFNTAFVNSRFPFSGFKIFLLRLFGAKIGKGCVVKPNVNIKYPWNLTMGNYSWIGENAWIDNLTAVTIGSNCCISQSGFLLTGNHDYAGPAFDLIVRPIVLEDGAWVGAKAVVCPGVTLYSHAILAVGSVATSDLQEWSIYQGNPAVKVRERITKSV
jgi:putative colanic acid biosynthesis acetyltransferase WcaF